MEQWSHILPWTIFSSHLCIYFLGKKRKSVIVWADIFLPIYVFLLAEKQCSDNKQFYKSLYLANWKQKPVIIFCFLTCNVECESLLYSHIKQVGVTKSFNGGLVCLIIVVVVVMYNQQDSSSIFNWADCRWAWRSQPWSWCHLGRQRLRRMRTMRSWYSGGARPWGGPNFM